MKLLYVATSSAAAWGVWHLQRAQQQQQQSSCAGRQAAGDACVEVVSHTDERASAAAEEPGAAPVAAQHDVLLPAVLVLPCALLTLLCTQAYYPLEVRQPVEST